MMCLVNITNVIIKNNPAPFVDGMSFQITFECIRDIPDELEWKVVYFGDSRDENYDQVLDTITIGPLPSGEMQFDWDVPSPDPQKIPSRENLLGVTALIIAVGHEGKEIFRVGYFVYNSLIEPEPLDADQQPTQPLDVAKVQRFILSDKPRITRADDEMDIGMELSSIVPSGNVFSTTPIRDNQNAMNMTSPQQQQSTTYSSTNALNDLFLNPPPQTEEKYTGSGVGGDKTAKVE